MNERTLIILGIEHKIELITRKGEQEEHRARAFGLPYDRMRKAKLRCRAKRKLRARIVELKRMTKSKRGN